jgi:hypothetical protein
MGRLRTSAPSGARVLVSSGVMSGEVGSVL